MRISDWSSDVCSSDLIDPALEAAARVAGECERLSGQRDALGREIGDFDKNVSRRLAAPAMLAAHDAGDIVDARVVGDPRHRFGQAVGLAVQEIGSASGMERVWQSV